MDKRPSLLLYSGLSQQTSPQRRGLLETLELKAHAWLTEQSTQAEIRLIACQHQVIEAKASLVLAKLQAQERIAQTTRQAEEEEAECLLHRQIRAASPEQARQILRHRSETERLLLERERLRQQRLSGVFLSDGGTGHEASPKALPQAPAVEEHLSDRQIESLATRAAIRLSQLPEDQAEHAWEAWRRELKKRLPAFAATEVERRAMELRDLSR